MKICENCGEETHTRFTVECRLCDGDIRVCHDCVNANPRHEECPEQDEEES
jgi:hypothetical protein